MIGACLILHGTVSAASGQSLPGTTTATSTVSTERPQTPEDDAAVPHKSEPDFVVVNLPTAMRLPLFKSNFRLTHRFAGNLKRGTFSQQASSLFGIDQGAIIGFEYRMAVAKDVQASFYRSSFDRTMRWVITIERTTCTVRKNSSGRLRTWICMWPVARSTSPQTTIDSPPPAPLPSKTVKSSQVFATSV